MCVHESIYFLSYIYVGHKNRKGTMKGEMKMGLKGIKRIIESIWHIVWPLKLINKHLFPKTLSSLNHETVAKSSRAGTRSFIPAG